MKKRKNFKFWISYFTCLLAGVPTTLCPSSVKATMEGVVLKPSAFSITLGVLPSITATQELVVPKSIPTIYSDLETFLEKKENKVRKKMKI